MKKLTTDEAIAICNLWLAHLQETRDKSVEMQRLATLARTQPEEARRRLAQLDRQPHVFAGATLEPAVRHLMALVRRKA